MKMINKIGLLILTLSLSTSVFAKEDVFVSRKTTSTDHKHMKFANDCQPASAQADLDVNNVRTKILNGGDMWWDLNSARYEVPKISDENAVRKHSMFAGALWIGGEDAGGNLKIAAMTYRQRGSDFWPGPLDTITANTSANRCELYDKIYEVTGDELIAFQEEWEENGSVVLDPQSNISQWPGNSINPTEALRLAPYFDVDGVPGYNPNQGDYPVLQNFCRGELIAPEDNEPEDQPDQMLFFVYNDKGNIHSETQGQPIGLELRTTAFAYATNDEINNMTFYTTEVVNRGFTTLFNTYFGQWVDPDLGNFADDYVGCDVELSLGFCYNGDDNDEGILGYGLNPPSVGVDFFEGPKKDTVINGTPTRVELGLSKFIYYNNDRNVVNGNPDIAVDFYNYLQGNWKNGECVKYGGDGITGTNGQCADFMFPGDTDPNFPGENWTEESVGNAPADRRFLQSSGPFNLEPGAVNKVTVGVVWAKASSGGATGSLDLLKASSRKAQELFNNCFDLIDGPDAPDVQVQELSNQLIVQLTNTKSSRVEEYDETRINDQGLPERYEFQGYRIYQLKDPSVGTGDLRDLDKVREVFSCDLDDNIIRLVNREFDTDLGQQLPKLMVEGNNEGLVHTIRLTEDAFATGSNKTLVNNKLYYYMVISYAALPGHPEEEYLAGRKIETFSATPRKPEPRLGGSNIQAGYGDGPELVRIDGAGNGGNIEKLTAEMESQILANGNVIKPVYDNSLGPVSISVIDPLKVPQGDFELTFYQGRSNDPDSMDWVLVKLPGGRSEDSVFSDYTIAYRNEQIITASATGVSAQDWGLAVNIQQAIAPGDPDDENNGFLGFEVIWEDEGNRWLTAVTDVDISQALSGAGPLDWIRSGTNGNNEATKDFSYHDYYVGTEPMDRFEVYEDIWEGRIAPYRLVSRNPTVSTAARPATLVQGFGYSGSSSLPRDLSTISSIELVITPDRDKWSRCIVLEMGEDADRNVGNQEKFLLRKSPSLDKFGQPISGETGRSWFPGYAINLETGERLNIAFGEDSYLADQNGADMKWNPTSNQTTKGSSSYFQFGGRHYVYVFGSYEELPAIVYPKLPIYDQGNEYRARFEAAEALQGSPRRDKINEVMHQCMWVMPFVMSAGEMEERQGMPVPPTEVRFRINVAKPYEVEVTSGENNGYPKFAFNTNDIYNQISQDNAKQALDLINVVPNPYYGGAFGAGYETNIVETEIKITNLPKVCDISIYTLDGQLVRRIKKDDEDTEISWDLKNSARVPIASGMYIIHIDAKDLGEKVLKWMGIMRELDLDSF
jgi:hypothetical protein